METVARIFDLAEKKYAEQRDFAEALGKSASMVSAWKTGVSKSYMKYLPEIATVLGTTVEYLLTGKTESGPPASAELSADEFQMVLAYRAADNHTRDLVDLALKPWKKSNKFEKAM